LKVKAMRIGVLATRGGISCSRIRFYEAQGVLPPPSRLSSGYRNYDERALQTLLFIDRARALGFSLQEIATHIHFPEGGNARKAHLLAKIQEKLAELDVFLAQLQSKRAALESILPELQRGLRADQYDMS
jgi:MerR family copper efflux transcriptional regulator